MALPEPQRERPTQQPERQLVARGRPRVWTVFALYVLLWLGMIVVGVALLQVSAALVEGDLPPDATPQQRMEAAAAYLGSAPVLLAVSLIASELLMVGLAVGAAGLSSVPLRARLRWAPVPTPRAAGVYLAGVLGALGLSQALDSLLALLDLEGLGALGELGRVVSESPPVVFAWLFVGAGLLAGPAEEIFFRGYVQTRLERAWPRGLAVAVAAALFGLMHADLIHSVLAFAMGLYLGGLASITGSVKLPLVAHAANNIVFLLATRWLDVAVSALTNLILLALGAILAVTGLIHVTRRVQTASESRSGGRGID